MLAGFLTLFVPSSHRRRRHALCRRMRTESRQSILLEWKPIGQPPVVFPYTLYLSLSKRDVDDDYECYKFAVWTATMTLSCSNGNTPRGLGAGTIRLPPTRRVWQWRKKQTCRLATKRAIHRPANFHQFSREEKGSLVQDEYRIPPLASSLARNCFDPYFPLLSAAIKGYHLQNNGRRLLRPRRRGGAATQL